MGDSDETFSILMSCSGPDGMKRGRVMSRKEGGGEILILRGSFDLYTSFIDLMKRDARCKQASTT